MREGSDEAVASFWDLMYIYKFGLPMIALPDPKGPAGSADLPTGTSITEQVRVHDELLMALISARLGDPHPQPNLDQVLTNPKIRLQSATALAQRLNTSLSQVNEEISTLKKLSRGDKR